MTPLCRSTSVALMLVLGLSACGPLADNKKRDTLDNHEENAQPVRAASSIVVTERGPRGGRLVFLTETGERADELTRIGPVPVRDNSPSWSPDGRFVVFASSRGRDTLAQTSLWVIEARAGAQPRRLTRRMAPRSAQDASVVDREPIWTPDGRALLFSSNRAGSFDLWRLPLEETAEGIVVAASEPVQLTRGPDHDFHPSIQPQPHGERIAFMRVDANGERSRLWMLEQDTPTPLTQGPADMTPAWSPDGRAIAFAAPSQDGKGADLFVIKPDGSDRRLVVAEPLADQTGPVWSADGRYLFCTSLYRSVATGKPVLSSITFVDLDESPRVLRALHSRVAVRSRMGPALDQSQTGRARPLDPDALHHNAAYKDALQLAVEQELIRAVETNE